MHMHVIAHPVAEHPPQCPFAQWQHHIVLGNQVFAQHHYTEANKHYEYSVGWPLKLLGTYQQCDDAMAAIVISHLNLADSYACLQQISEQERCLCEAHHYVIRTLNDNQRSHNCRHAALLHARHTQLALLTFQQNNPMRTRAHETLQFYIEHAYEQQSWQ